MDVQHIEQLLYYWRCSFSGLELRVLHVQLASYGSKHALHTLQYAILCVLIQKLENYRLYMDALHNKRLLCYHRHLFCGLELHEKSDWRGMALECITVIL